MTADRSTLRTLCAAFPTPPTRTRAAARAPASLLDSALNAGQCYFTGISPPAFFFFVKRGRWWPVPECPTRISDVLRLERSNSAPSVASSALLLYCNLQSLHGKLCAGGRSDFQLVMMMMREDITWLHWFHNHAALWGLTPACAVQHRLSFK